MSWSVDQYFAPVATDVFGSLMRELEARRSEVTSTLVRYQTKNWFVDLHVLLEDGPRYCPRVGIGPFPERSPPLRQSQFEALYALPDGSPLRRYWFEWRYTSPDEMRVSYTRTRDEIFEPYVIPLLRDPSMLGNLLTMRAAIIEAEWTEEIQAHNDSIHRRNAWDAKQAKDYRGYLTQMRLIPPARRSRTEQAWIEYAEKKLR